MNKIAILTATYNHPEKLNELYESLKRQYNKDFLWCIVDDGSDKTTKHAVDIMIEENNIDIKYYWKENGGKNRAITFGLDRLSEFDFVLFVDDDEYLYSEAIDIVKDYEEKYRNTTIGVIHFNRANEKDEIISNSVNNNDQIMSAQKRKRKGIQEDGYVGYYISKLKNIRSPEFKNEKYVGPSVLFMTLCREYDMLWASSDIILGKTEYLSDGITMQGRSLRVKNPKGMYVYCLLRQHKDSGIILRWVYSVYGYAYLNYNNLKEADVRKELNNYNEKLISAAKPFSRILTLYWKIKFS